MQQTCRVRAWGFAGSGRHQAWTWLPAHVHLSRDGAYARGREGPRWITVAVAIDAEAMQQSQLWARGRAPHGSSPQTHGGGWPVSAASVPVLTLQTSQ